jgi:hypothetical protein
MRAAPQTAHGAANGVPQLVQNVTPSGLTVPHDRQFMESYRVDESPEYYARSHS